MGGHRPKREWHGGRDDGTVYCAGSCAESGYGDGHGNVLARKLARIDFCDSGDADGAGNFADYGDSHGGGRSGTFGSGDIDGAVGQSSDGRLPCFARLDSGPPQPAKSARAGDPGEGGSPYISSVTLGADIVFAPFSCVTSVCSCVTVSGLSVR